jgi:hypothetical protein
MPVIGFLSVASPDAFRPMAAAFRQGLQEAGFIDGQTSPSNTVGQNSMLIVCQDW